MQAIKTLAAVNQRESINGSDAERRDSENFERLTKATRVELEILRELLVKL